MAEFNGSHQKHCSRKIDTDDSFIYGGAPKRAVVGTEIELGDAEIKKNNLLRHLSYSILVLVV